MPTLDLAPVITDCASLLNAQSTATLEWWTVAELYEYASNFAQNFCRTHAMIGAHRTGYVFVTGQVAYTLPAEHCCTVQVFCGAMAMRETTMQEVEALNPNWLLTTAENPASYMPEGYGPSTMIVYPVPSTPNVPWSIAELETPAEITAGASTTPICPALGELFLLEIVARALRKETRGARPETSAMIDQMMAPLREVAAGLWGI